ncbi:MAG TPA: histidine kinase [Pseudonocardiaceae bacterium]
MTAVLSFRPIAALIRRSGPLPAPTRRMFVVDVVLAVAITAYGLVYTIGARTLSAPEDFGRNMALTVLACAPLALRRRFPLGCFVVVSAATVLTHSMATPRLALLTTLIAAYSAAMYSPYRTPAKVALLAVAALISTYFRAALPDIPSVFTSFAVIVPLILATETIRTARARVLTLAAQQDEQTQHAIEQERARIARELHDVVTHNVSVMVVQAGAARKIMATAPDTAATALLAVEASGRTAMAELRQVMELLAPGDEERELAPQPGLDQLPALIDRVRATGMRVEYAVSGAPRPLAQGVDLAGYRVVQEALTNTVKHAEGASARVQVEFGEAELRITVTDAGGAPGPSAATGNGRGLLGLRERLAVYDGSLDTGPLDGGFRLMARIPV